MRCFILLVAWFVVAGVTAETNQPTMDKLAERYVHLALALGLHDTDYVDAYYGPAEWKTEAAAEKKSLTELEQTARQLSSELKQIPLATTEIDRLRLSFFERQLVALVARIQFVEGHKKSFDEEAQLLYDATPPTFTEAHFSEILARLEKKIPGQGPLSQRYEQWHKAYIIPKEKLDTVFQLAIKECRARTLAYIKLPPNEGFTVEYVTDKPWGGYNWYKGNYQSVIQVNTDVPAYIDRAIDLAAHEGYPGHHVYNALLEKNLVRDQHFVEFSVMPLFSPLALISEGSANYGREVAFSKTERMDFEKEVLWPAAGLDSKGADDYYAVQEMTKELSYAANEAARKLVNGEIDERTASSWLQKYALLDEARAQQRVRFIQRYRSYVINYNLGEDLVRSYIEGKGGTADQPEKRWHEFELLLSAPHLPSELQRAAR